MLISSMSQYESGFNTNASHVEKFKNSKQENVVSRGLLQISSESGNGYGCHIAAEADLDNPAINLACGVRIMNRYIVKDGVVTAHDGIWRGGARYWNVLRVASTLPGIRNATRSLPGCKAEMRRL